MGDETPNTMNLDLNLDPFPSTDDELGSETLGEGGPRAVNLEEWIEGQRVRFREAVRRSTRYRWRSVRPGPIPPEPRSIALDLMVNSSTAADGGLQTGEGSVPSQQRNNEETKTCENNAVLVTNEELKEGEHNSGALPDDPVEVELTQGGPTNLDMAENRRVSSLLRRRSHARRAATISNLTSALSSRDRLLDTFFRRHHHVEREQEQPPPVDDRDSMSSIAAVIHSESQTFDTAVEIDSTVALSTSSSGRRNDASRVSDVDSGDSRT